MSWWGGEDTTATTAALDVQQELEDLRAEHDVVQQSLEMKNNLLKTTQSDLKDAIREAKELQAKVDEKDAAISQLQNELLATKTQLQTVEAESKKMSSMSGDKDGLNAMLQTKIKELAEASAKAATVETLQKELDEKTKEGISLHANVKALEAKTQDEGRELQELRAKLQKIHGEQVTTPLTAEAAKAEGLTTDEELQRLRTESAVLQAKCDSLGRRLMKAAGFQWRMGIVATAFRQWKDYVRYVDFYNEMDGDGRPVDAKDDDRSKIEVLKREIELLRRELEHTQQSAFAASGSDDAPATPGARRASLSATVPRSRLSRLPSISEALPIPRASIVDTSQLDALRASHARKEAELDQAKKALDAAAHSEQLRAAHASKEQELDAARQAYLNQLFVQSKLVSQVVTASITKALGHVGTSM